MSQVLKTLCLNFIQITEITFFKVPEVPKKVVPEEKVHTEVPKKAEPPPPKGTFSVLIKSHNILIGLSEYNLFLILCYLLCYILIFVGVTV